MELFDSFEQNIQNKLFNANIQPNINEISTELIKPSRGFKNGLYFENLTDDEFFGFYGVDKNFVEFYKKIIKSGVGCIFTGGVNIGSNKQCDYARINLDKNIIGSYKEITKFAHMNYCKIFLKIKSVWGRFKTDKIKTNHPKTASNFGLDPENNKKILIRASDNKINDMINDLCQVTMLSSIAGFDGIMIDASFDNLIGELSSNEYNKRVFGYFSSCDDFLTKSLKKINIKNNTIILRISLLSLFENDTKNANYCKIFRNFNENELINRLFKYIELGVDGFEFVFGCPNNEFLNKFNQFEDEYLFANFVEKLRCVLNKKEIKNKFNEDVMIFYHDNISNIDTADKLFKNKIINFIDITRNLYSDVKFVKNLINKKSSLKCIKCSHCDKKAHFNNKIECLINPSLTYDFNNNNLKVNNYNVAVVGGGISGIVCTLTLLKRGFSVSLFERKGELNHTGKLTTVFGFDKLLLEFYSGLEKQLIEYEKAGRLKILKNNNFSATGEELENFQSIVIASGFSSKLLTVSGAVQSHIFNIYDALNNENVFQNKKHIVIYAKSELSLKLALYLTTKNYKNITIIIKDVEEFFKKKNANLLYFFCNLYQRQVNFYYFSKLIRINEDNIDLKICKNLDKNSLSTFYKIMSNANIKQIHQQINIDCDLLVYEPEIKPNNSLYIDIVNKNYTGQLYLIGNALENNDLAEIIKSGYFVGKNL